MAGLESTALTTTQEFYPQDQFLSGRVSHYVLTDNRTGPDAPDMNSSTYLKGVVAGIQQIASLVILGQADAAGPGTLRFAVENCQRPADDFAANISAATGIALADADAVPPVAGISVAEMTY